jgi:hypothetical protein
MTTPRKPAHVVRAAKIEAGFRVDHDAEGHSVLYWTDHTHGGPVWRGCVA